MSTDFNGSYSRGIISGDVFTANLPISFTYTADSDSYDRTTLMAPRSDFDHLAVPETQVDILTDTATNLEAVRITTTTCLLYTSPSPRD